ncbi:MAG: RNA-binding domain-containing protein [Candidatus Geothermarchaeota archaeon]
MKRKRIKEESEITKALYEVEISAEATLYPCEDYDKVVKVLYNVIDGELVKETVNNRTVLKVVSKDKKQIYRIFNHFRRRRVLATLRAHLMKYLTNDAIVIPLHKQAAYAGVLSICDIGDSPLGEVIVRIKVKEPQKIVEYFTRF